MTDKTEAQPEALRLAASITASGQFTPLLTLDSAAAELRRQHAEIERLRALAATCYAGLGGECDLPVIWLDALNDAANGDPFDTDGLLPYTSAIRAQLVAQTNRAAAAEQQVTALTQRLDMANRLNTDARNELALANDAAAKGDLARANAGGMELRIAELEAENAAIVLTIKRSGLELLKTAKGFELTKQFKAEAQLSARQAAPDGWRIALERIADPRNKHFAGDAQIVALDALSAALPPPEREPLTEEWHHNSRVESAAGIRDALSRMGVHLTITTILQLVDITRKAHGIGATNDNP